MKLISNLAVFGALCITSVVTAADDSVVKPRNTPLTRPEMKQYLEEMKQRKPRIPLPELTDEEKARSGDRGGVGGGYEGRLRSLYLSGEGRGDFGFGTGGAGGSGNRPPGGGNR